MKNGTDKKKQYISKPAVASEVNPWADSLAYTIKTGTKITGFVKNDYDMVDRETGELASGGMIIGRTKVVDKEEFVKWYGAGVVATLGLSKTARDVFSVFIHAYMSTNTTKVFSDRIYLNLTTAQRDWGYSKSRGSWTSGRNELIGKEIIAEITGMVGWYWINPNLFYKGDRMAIVEQVVVRGSESHTKMLEEQKRLVEGEKHIEMNDGDADKQQDLDV